MNRTAPQLLPIVELTHANVVLEGRSILAGVSMSVRSGEVWQIHGPAGSGKSILLEVLSGRHRLASGTRSYPAFVADSPDAAIGIPPRFSIRLVSQQEQRRVAQTQSSFYQARWHTLWTAAISVKDFLAPERVLGLYPYEKLRVLPVRRDYAEERERCLVEMRLDHYTARCVAQLSNGELKKLLLLAAHLASPALLLLDDPLGGLDPQSRESARDAIVRWCAEGQTLVYCACHETELADVATYHFHLAPRFAAHPFGITSEAQTSGVTSGTRTSGTQTSGTQTSETRTSGVLISGVLTSGTQTSGLEGWIRREHPAPRSKALRTIASTDERARDLDELDPSAAVKVTPPKSPSRGQVISCRGVCVTASDSILLDQIDWDVHPGEHWLVTGPNGAGKSTLLALLMGDHPQAYSNDILVLGRQLGNDTTLWERRQVAGFVAPELSWHYPQGWSLLDVVLSGFGANVGLHRACSEREQALALEWLERFDLAELAHACLASVSECAKCLTLVARAMVQEPGLLLLDEPTQNVDEQQRGVVYDVLGELAHSGRTTIILVSHHTEERPSCMTHHLSLAKGRVLHQGPVMPSGSTG